MRDEQTMFNLILGIAQADARIRAVILNGSRANPHARRDMFQDYDVIFGVSEVAAFVRAPEWLHQFGEMMIMQTPDAMFGSAPRVDEGFAYLMQFTDGTRIDLTLLPTAALRDYPHSSLSIPLLDKDHLLPEFPPPSERDYLPQPPTAAEFADVCNEFWWVCPYVAKALWRGQVFHARVLLETILRPQLMKILVWQIGVQTNFARNPGKMGQNFELLLTPEQYVSLQSTCPTVESESVWQAALNMAVFFDALAVALARELDLPYPQADAQRVAEHLHRIRHLARDIAQPE